MDAQVVLGLIGSGISVAGISTSYVISYRRHRKDLAIARQKELNEKEAREKAERERFYLTTAANLVVSADKLQLTGPQKKEYVMLWLENEAGKSDVVVDKALMSVAIERTILILNDHKDKAKPISELLEEELDTSVERERLIIAQQTEQAEVLLAKETHTLNKNAKNSVKAANNAVANARDILRIAK